jgi:calcineurin-like phosphoesterase family protein
VSLLNGKIRLVLGNHDKRKKPHWYNDLGFDAVYEFPIIIEDWFIVSHEPIKYLTQKMPYVNIHGHTHDEEYANPQRVNVCWEILDGYPISFDEIKSRFKDIDEYDKAGQVFVQDRHKNAAMNYNEGYSQGFIDGKKEKRNSK